MKAHFMWAFLVQRRAYGRTHMNRYAQRKDLVMKLSEWIGLCSGLALAFLYGAAIPAAAQGYKAEKAALPMPQELSVGLRDVLAGDAFRVTGPNGVLCEVWVRKAVPSTAAANPDKSIAFAEIAEGTLVGAIRFPSSAVDYRGTGIRPGVYTLRYALIPEDGNHLGAAPPQRDFLLLGPATDDTDPATVTRDQTLEMSRKVTGMRHPTVWSLSLSNLGAPEFPAMNHQEDPDCWMLNFSLVFVGGKTVPAALVVHGQAQS
jgi:hypothetical protein